MSETREVYAGRYLRVWMPIETVRSENYRICLACREKMCHKYCPRCGTKTEATERQRRKNMYNLLEDVFGEDDTFMITSFPDYDIVLPNMEQSGGEFLEDEDEIEFSDSELTGDWIKLMKELDKRSIRYEIHNGTVSFFM